jgi:hypothetical protein
MTQSFSGQGASAHARCIMVGYNREKLNATLGRITYIYTSQKDLYSLVMAIDPIQQHRVLDTYRLVSTLS